MKGNVWTQGVAVRMVLWAASFTAALGCSSGRIAGDEVSGRSKSTLVTHNGLSENGLSENGLSENGLSENGLSENGLSENGLSENGLSENGLSENGLSENGLSVLDYM